jgi:aspartate racemase
MQPEETAPYKRIGIVGGMGPYAGLDLVKKVFDQTVAARDQDHLDVILLSTPSVPDRTRFLLEGKGENPAHVIFQVLESLEASGAVVAGIPCNTAHSPRILDVVLRELTETQSTLRFVSIIEETIRHLRERFPNLRTVGVLSTTGTLRTKVYSDPLRRHGYHVIEPGEALQEECVQKAIYDTTYGIKAESNPVTAKARSDIERALSYLKDEGAEVVVLGCTELPLAISDPLMFGLPMIDPTLLLARALIRETHPEKLKPLGKT